MKTVTELLDLAKEKMVRGNWSEIFIAVDLHGTILKRSKWRTIQNGSVSETSLNSDVSSSDLQSSFFPMAEMTLREISKTPGLRLILFTSSTDAKIEKYLKMFQQIGIIFCEVNCNSEVISDVQYADFSKKFYFDVLFDDKAGFDSKKDWTEIFRWVQENSEFLKTRSAKGKNEKQYS